MKDLDLSEKLVLEYNGNSEQHYKEYFDSRIELLEYYVREYRRKIKNAEKRITEYKREKNSLDGYAEDWDSKIELEDTRIMIWNNVVEEILYEQIGTMYEIKHQIMKID